MDAQIFLINKLDHDFKYKIRRIYFVHIMYKKKYKLKINFYVINSNGNHINTAILYWSVAAVASKFFIY